MCPRLTSQEEFNRDHDFEKLTTDEITHRWKDAAKKNADQIDRSNFILETLQKRFEKGAKGVRSAHTLSSVGAQAMSRKTIVNEVGSGGAWTGSIVGANRSHRARLDAAFGGPPRPSILRPSAVFATKALPMQQTLPPHPAG